MTYNLNSLHEQNETTSKKEKFRQYFSSDEIANLMASMMNYDQKNIKILDPGAGTGSLFTACVNKMIKKIPDSIEIISYEIDDALFDKLDISMKHVNKICKKFNVKFSGKIINRNFIQDYVKGVIPNDFTHVIMNPPYGKINKSSKVYNTLKNKKLETTNMYSAFIDISHNLLLSGSQMVFISPRSFCNGRYFESFRKNFLKSMSIQRIHLFNSRKSSFSDVLQENVIVCAKKHHDINEIIVSSSETPTDNITQRVVKKSDVMFHDDPQMFIHIISDERGISTSNIMRHLPCTIHDLNITVSTGKIVDFRIKDELRFDDKNNTVPLVRPFNIRDKIHFPAHNKKHCNFILSNEKSRKLLLNNGNYVLVKRFTTPEQKRRVTAAVWTKSNYDSKLVGFENRVNYFHENGNGLPYNLARGLCVFLNSSMVDKYFRQFSGNTQVNTTDLKYLRYPTRQKLEMMGNKKIKMNSVNGNGVDPSN